MVDLFTTPHDNEDIMAITAKKQSDSTQSTTPSTTVGSTKAETVAVETGTTQIYYVPEFGVSVEAKSMEQAIEKAKKLKGVK